MLQSEATLHKVAELLGGVFNPTDEPQHRREYEPPRGVIVLADGVEFRVHPSWPQNHRLELSPKFPEHRDRYTPRACTTTRDIVKNGQRAERLVPYFTCAFYDPKRDALADAGAIAKRIMSRFLPRYRETYAQAVAWVTKQNRWTDSVFETGARAAVASERVKDPYRVHVEWAGMARVDVRVSGLTAEQLERLVDWLNEEA